MNPHAQLRPELKLKIQNWIISFYHLDPRYQILSYFNLETDGLKHVCMLYTPMKISMLIGQ